MAKRGRVPKSIFHDGTVYDSAAEASEVCGLTVFGVHSRCKNTNFPNTRYATDDMTMYPKPEKKNLKLPRKPRVFMKVLIDGVVYNSVREAAETLNIKTHAIQNRLSLAEWPNFARWNEGDPIVKYERPEKFAMMTQRRAAGKKKPASKKPKFNAPEWLEKIYEENDIQRYSKAMFNKAQQDYDFLVWRQKLADENIMYKNAWPEFRLTFEEFVANRPAMLAKHQHGLYHEDGKRRDHPLVVGD